MADFANSVGDVQIVAVLVTSFALMLDDVGPGTCGAAIAQTRDSCAFQLRPFEYRSIRSSLI
jgi:hypothetical protein